MDSFSDMRYSDVDGLGYEDGGITRPSNTEPILVMRAEGKPGSSGGDTH